MKSNRLDICSQIRWTRQIDGWMDRYMDGWIDRQRRDKVDDKKMIVSLDK